MLSFVVGKGVPESYTMYPNGDADCSDLVTAVDALVILSSVVGKDVSGFCVGSTIVGQLEVEPDSTFLYMGDARTLVAILTGPDGDTIFDRTPDWHSADITVVTVDPDGNLTGQSDGAAYVVAQVDDLADSSLVRVFSTEIVVTVTPGEILFTAIREQEQFTATVRDSLGIVDTMAVVEWYSTDEGVVSVSSEGFVQAEGNGTAYVVASSQGVLGAAAVHVEQVLASIFITGSEREIAVGEPVQLGFGGRDANNFGMQPPEGEAIWGSGNLNVATVDPNGLVSTYGVGPVTISVFFQGLSAGYDIDVRLMEDILHDWVFDGFRLWWLANHDYWGPALALSVAADEHTSSWTNVGMKDISSEPRTAWNNDPSYPNANTTRRPWDRLYSALTQIREAFLFVDGGGEWGDGGQDTPRAQAFGKFVQGLSLGTLALVYDQAFVVDEYTDLQAQQLQGYGDVMAAALAKLDEAIVLANSNSFTVDPHWVGGVEVDNVLLVQLAHSYKARFLASVGRTPAERDAADWSLVQAELDQGITSDFALYADDVVWWDYLKANGEIPGWARGDYKTIGPSDQSGAYQSWIALPVEDRNEFQIETDDRRITSGDTLNPAGLYFEDVGPSPFRVERGTYHFSLYADIRYNDYTDDWVGEVVEVTMTELDLLRAEAMMRGGENVGAAVLINQTRVANGRLPAVTIDGDPAERCVPRMDDGTCGDLWEALKYEKRIEVYHTGMGIAFFDDRGWGDLVPLTLFHFPVPGQVLADLGLPIYTFGGSHPQMVGGPRTSLGGASPAALEAYWTDLRRRAFDPRNDRDSAAPARRARVTRQ